MDATTLFPTKWLSAADLGEGNRRVTIKAEHMEQIGEQRKLVIYFGQLEKGLVMNKTNTQKMIEILGKNTDNWIGKDVLLYKAITTYQGKETDAIRIKAASSL